MVQSFANHDRQFETFIAEQIRKKLALLGLGRRPRTTNFKNLSDGVKQMRFKGFHKKILERMLAGWYLQETPDGFLLRKYLGISKRTKKAVYLIQRIRPDTISAMIRFDLIKYENAGDPNNRNIVARISRITDVKFRRHGIGRGNWREK
jgi:hypothetical protein